MLLTDEQKAVIAAFCHHDSILVNALAGTGKTSTAIECIRVNHNLRGIYLCFNRAIAAEMNARLARIGAKNITAQTIHSFAYNIVRGALGNRSIDDAGAYEYIRLYDFQRNGGGQFSDRFDLARIHAIAKEFISAWCHSAYTDFDAFLRAYKPKASYAQLYNLNVDIDHFHSRIKNFWQKLLADSQIPMAHDMYLKFFHLNFRNIANQFGYDFVIADEAQDLFPLAEDMLKVFRENGACLLSLGDRYQQIYSWNRSINTMERLEHDSLVLALTQSFRCGNDVVDMALPWLRLLGYTGRYLPRSCDASPKYACAALSRTVCGVFDILRQCTENGLETGEIYLVGGSASYDFSIIQDRLHFMAGRRNRVKNSNMRQCANDRAYDKLALSLMDREMIKAKQICSRLGHEKTQKLLNAVKTGEFSNGNDNPRMVVSTGHKAKGMEFGHVILENFSNFTIDYKDFTGKYKNPMFASRIPTPDEIRRYELCEFAFSQNSQKELSPLYLDAEELRLNYVALTRAIDTLNPCMLDIQDNGEYEKALSLIEKGQVVLTDRDMDGNMVIYNRH